MGNNPFQPATRHKLKGRIALDGPTGSGKSWTALALARELAGPDGVVNAVDTERGSLSLYSDQFSFNVLEWVPPYDPRKLADVLKNAAGDSDVMVIDSMSHFWQGEGGTLDIVTAAGARQGGNNYAGWNVGTPALRSLIDTILGMDCHVIVTMRSKMEHILQEDERGRQVPTKVGMAPVMRADIDYEFTLCISYDLDHRGVVTKSRCSPLADAMIPAGKTHVQELADTFRIWLAEGAPEPELIDEQMRARLVNWANSLQGRDRAELRELWPVGVPQLRDPNLTAAQAERIMAMLHAIHPEPEKVAGDGEAEGDGTPTVTADENGDPVGDAEPTAAAKPAKAAGKKAPAKKAAAKKAPAQRAAEHAEAEGDPSPAKAELDRMADEVAAAHPGPVQPNEAEPEAQPDEAPPDEAGPDEAATPAEAAADESAGTEGPGEGGEAAQGDSASDGEPEPAEALTPSAAIDWKVEGKNMGLGAAAVLQQVRDLAAEKQLDLPPTLSRVPDDAGFQSELMARLTAIAAAKAAREQG